MSSLWLSLKESIVKHGINGIPLEIIQKRSQPLPDRTLDPQWKFRSFEGFIGPEEFFLDVIENDWKSLEMRKTNPNEVALNIKKLLTTVEQIRQEKGYGVMKPISLNFNSSLVNSQPQQLTVTRSIFNGPQHSLFFNESIPESKENTTWNEEYSIENEKLNISVLLGGNATSGVVDYIDRYCFFEGGGAQNKYRVEPSILLAILTGKCDEKTIDAVLGREKLKENETLEEIQKMNSFLETVTLESQQDENKLKRLQQDKEMLTSRIQQLQDNLSNYKQERERIALHLKKFF